MSDKKKLILVIVIVLVAAFLIFGSRGGNKTVDGFGNELAAVMNSDYYSATGSATICSSVFDIRLTKSLNNVQFGFTGSENADYSSLITKYNNTLYFNTAPFVSKGGITSVKCADASTEKEVPVTLKQVILDSFNSELFTFSKGEGFSEAKLDNPDNWKEYFEGLANSIKENKEAILKNYADTQIIEKEIDVLIEDLNKLAASTASGNTFTLSLSYNEETEQYSFGIDFSADFESLPSFIKADSFDANKFTLLISSTFTTAENTVNVPAGYVYSMGSDTINEFITNCWDSLFAKKAYRATNEVTIKPDSVTNVINLGSTTETYQYLFDKDGVSEAVLIVSSYDKSIIKQYTESYQLQEQGSWEDLVVYNRETKKFSLSFTLSDSAIDSLNKIATTPNGLGTFLKTSEGVVPIV